MTDLLFAEYLGNIHTINLTVVSNEPDAGTLKLDNRDGSVVTLNSSDGTCSHLSLSTPAEPNFNIADCLPISPATCKTTRVKVLPPVNDHKVTNEQAETPWSAASLPDGASLICHGINGHIGPCNTTLVPASALKDCRDLPSETWAEMMDLWHCHKPDEPEAGDEAGTGKGYSASSRLSARQGTLFVDTLTFLVFEGDCTNIEVSQASLL